MQHFVANMSREEKFDTYLLKTTETRRNFQIDLFQLLEEGQRQLAKDEQAEQDEGNFPTILYEKQHRSFTWPWYSRKYRHTVERSQEFTKFKLIQVGLPRSSTTNVGYASTANSSSKFKRSQANFSFQS